MSYLPSVGPAAGTPLWHGVYDAVVTHNIDPADAGRVRMNVPQVLGSAVSSWAAPIMSGTTPPNVGSRVLCMFLGGNPNKPLYTAPTAAGALVVSSLMATGGISVAGAAMLSGSLGVAGATSLSSLVTTGNATLGANATVAGTLGVTGVLTANAGLSINGVTVTEATEDGAASLLMPNLYPSAGLGVWSKFSPLSNSWAVASSYTGAWVRLLIAPANCIQISAVMTPGGGTNNNDGTTVGNLGNLAYFPGSPQVIQATTDVLGAGSPRFSLSTAGVLKCFSIAASSSQITINAIVPLDSL